MSLDWFTHNPAPEHQPLPEEAKEEPQQHPKTEEKKTEEQAKSPKKEEAQPPKPPGLTPEERLAKATELKEQAKEF